MKTFLNLQVGDMISYTVHGGIGLNGPERKTVRGRVRMAFESHVVVLKAGRNFPDVVDASNIVKIPKSRMS